MLKDLYLQLLLGIFISTAKQDGRAAVVRAATIPEKQIAKAHPRGSAAYIDSMNKRDALANAAADFALSLVPDA